MVEVGRVDGVGGGGMVVVGGGMGWMGMGQVLKSVN